MNRGNLKRTAISAAKGVQKKAARLGMYAEALEVEDIQYIVREINTLAEQAQELIEGDDGEEE